MVRADALQIEQRQVRLHGIVLHAVQPLGVEQRAMIGVPQVFDRHDRRRIVVVIMEADDIRQLDGALLPRIQRRALRVQRVVRPIDNSPGVGGQRLNRVAGARGGKEALHSGDALVAAAAVAELIVDVPDFDALILCVLRDNLAHHLVEGVVAGGVIHHGVADAGHARVGRNRDAAVIAHIDMLLAEGRLLVALKRHGAVVAEDDHRADAVLGKEREVFLEALHIAVVFLFPAVEGHKQADAVVADFMRTFDLAANGGHALGVAVFLPHIEDAGAAGGHIVEADSPRAVIVPCPCLFGRPLSFHGVLLVVDTRGGSKPPPYGFVRSFYKSVGVGVYGGPPP